MMLNDLVLLEVSVTSDDEDSKEETSLEEESEEKSSNEMEIANEAGPCTGATQTVALLHNGWLPLPWQRAFSFSDHFVQFFG